jgi:site-specific DNA recombinase
MSMKKVYGYIRISTAKQGSGVSLQEQKEAIQRYANKHTLNIVKWYEEQETAAKQGRPLFGQMIKLLQKRKVGGVIIHKIDRSARNLKDWAIIGDLLENGIEIHFAHESLDMNTRGGRLAADIQAVIASDYIRNLRQEALKGLYGRLKQGVYPFEAPTGYLDNGRGQLKTIDPVKGPFIKNAFQSYASGKYTLQSLTEKMSTLGLYNLRGGKISITSMSKILNNPFYAGIMRVKGQTFKGRHEPLISPDLYKQVQRVLQGKLSTRTIKHNFLFRRLIKCSECQYSTIGEKQKGYTYYRCHTKDCPTKTIRQDRVEDKLIKLLQRIQLTPMEFETSMIVLRETDLDWEKEQQKAKKSLRIREGQLEQKLDRLTDAYVGNLIDKNLFERRKQRLLFDLQDLSHKKQRSSLDVSDLKEFARDFLEQLKSVANSYQNVIHEEKREIVETITSNLSALGRNVCITMRSPFLELLNRPQIASGDPERYRPRTCTAHFAGLATSGDNYADCTIVRRNMQEVFDIIVAFHEEKKKKEKEAEEEEEKEL